MLIMSKSKEVSRHLATAVELLIALGFIINLKKSVLSPTQELEFLGFILNSRKMTISVPSHKLHSLRKLARQMRSQERTMVQVLAQILETMLSAILPVPLHYRNLEVAKTKVLKEGCSYDSQVNVKSDMRLDLTWWVDNAKHHNVPPLQITHWDRTIKSDASTIGWRANCQGRNTMDTTGEKLSHQLSGAPGSLPCPEVVCSSGDFNLDPTLAGQRNSHCLFEQDGRYSFTVSVQTGSTDLGLVHRGREAERTSRLRVSSHDRFQCLATSSRHLSPTSGEFQSIHGGFICFSDQYPTTNILQLETRPSSSYSGCPFHFMENHHPYIFPPFAPNSRCLNKLREGKVTAILIAPVWTNQIWFPQFLQSFDRLTNPSPTEPQHLDEPTGAGTAHPIVIWRAIYMYLWPCGLPQEILLH